MIPKLASFNSHLIGSFTTPKIKKKTFTKHKDYLYCDPRKRGVSEIHTGSVHLGII